jgi:carboxyl-terminal processing protease
MKKILLVIVLVLVAFGGGYLVNGKIKPEKVETKIESKDQYIIFAMEIWDKIKENYWEKTTDDELSNIYLLAVDKITGVSHGLLTRDKAGVEKLLSEANKDISNDKKKEFYATLGDMVLANLKPFGRSRLYAQKDEKALSEVVNNVTTTDHFETLGIGKSATTTEIKNAYEEKIKEATTAAKKAELESAYKTLKDEDSKKNYELAGVEPTIDYKQIGQNIFWAHMTKFSPNSLNEFVNVMNNADKIASLNTLIFDLRGNIGGAIDQLPYFLGPFIGQDSYAYQFYHQGDKVDFKTKTGWLNSMVRYKKVVVLIDENSQSTAEVTAAALKKYNVGAIVGTTTKGWGTVERVIPLDNQIAKDEKYSIFLVHHVTLRDDGMPIEGRGVDPQISIKDPNWKKELMERFNDAELVKAVEEIYK